VADALGSGQARGGRCPFAQDAVPPFRLIPISLDPVRSRSMWRDGPYPSRRFVVGAVGVPIGQPLSGTPIRDYQSG
jgi:hypothetical protein